MPTFATSQDVVLITGQTLDADALIRLDTVLLPAIERAMARRAGWMFFDATDPASPASQDWLLAAATWAVTWLASEAAEVMAARAGALKSETFLEYSYTLKSASDLPDPTVPPALVMQLLAAYPPPTPAPPIPSPVVLVVAGPTRNHRTWPVEGDDDASRRGWP